MKKVIIFIFFTAILTAFAREGFSENQFVYNSHGKRDPFVPLIGLERPTITAKSGIEGIDSISDVKFQGVAFDSRGNKVAILNGEMIRVGQVISRVTLKGIEGDTITLLIGDEEYALSLYEKDGGLFSE